MAGGVVGIAGNVQAAASNNPSPNTTTGGGANSASTNSDSNNFQGTGMSAAQVAALTVQQANGLGISPTTVGQAVHATVTEQQYNNITGGGNSGNAGATLDANAKLANTQVSAAPPALDAATVANNTNIVYNGNQFTATSTVNGRTFTSTGTVPATPLTAQGGAQRDYAVNGLVFGSIAQALPSINDTIANVAGTAGISKDSVSSNVFIDVDKGTYTAYNAAGGLGKSVSLAGQMGTGQGTASFISSGNLGQGGSTVSTPSGAGFSILNTSVPSTSSLTANNSYSFAGGAKSQILLGGSQLGKTVSILAGQGYSNSQISDIAAQLYANPKANLVETIDASTGELSLAINPTGTVDLSKFTLGIKPNLAGGQTYTISGTKGTGSTFAPTNSNSAVAYSVISNLANRANTGITNTGVSLGLTTNFLTNTLFGGKFAGANAGNLTNPNAYALFAAKQQIQPTPNNPIASNIGQFAIEGAKNVVGLGFGVAQIAVAPQIALPAIPASSFAFGGQIAKEATTGNFGAAAADVGFLLLGKPASAIKLGEIEGAPIIIGEQKITTLPNEKVTLAITQNTTGLSDIKALQGKGGELGLDVKQVVGFSNESKVYPNLNFSVGHGTTNFTAEYGTLAQNIKGNIAERNAAVATNLGESAAPTLLRNTIRQPTEFTTNILGNSVTADLNVLSTTKFSSGSFIRQYGATQVPFKAANDLALSNEVEIPLTSTLFVAKNTRVLANKLTTKLNVITQGRTPIISKVTTFKEIPLKSTTGKISAGTTFALKKGEGTSVLGRTGLEANLSNKSSSAFILNEGGTTERGKLFVGQELNTGNFAMHLSNTTEKTKGGEVINVTNPTEASLAAFTAFKRGHTNVLLQGKGTLIADTVQLLNREVPNLQVKGLVEVKKAPPSKSVLVRTGLGIRTALTNRVNVILRKPAIQKPTPNARIQLQDIEGNQAFTNFAKELPSSPKGIELEAAKQNEGALKVLQSKQEETQGNYISSKTPFGKEIEFRSPVNRRADTSIPQIANARLQDINQHLNKAQEQAAAKEHNTIFTNSNEIHNIFSGTATKVEAPKSKGVYSTQALMGTSIEFGDYELPQTLPPRQAGKVFGTTGLVTGGLTKTAFTYKSAFKEQVGQATRQTQGQGLTKGLVQPSIYKTALAYKQANQFKEASAFKEGLAYDLLTKQAQVKAQVKVFEQPTITKQLTTPAKVIPTTGTPPTFRPKPTFPIISTNNNPISLFKKLKPQGKNNQRFKTSYVPSVIGLEFAPKISKKKAAGFSKIGGFANSFTRPAIR